jgi:repressor LexA
MDKMLNSRQKALLKLIQRGEEGVSLSRMAEEIGVRSKNTALFHLRQLEKKGLIRRNPANSMDITVMKDPVKDLVYVSLYGMAQCGPRGLLAEENVRDRIPISTKAFGVSGDVFLVKARGDSMQPVIYEGDLVLCVRQESVDSGSIAAIVHNRMPKIKKVIFEGGERRRSCRLVSLNGLQYPDEVIEANDLHEIQVCGRVKSVIRPSLEGR